MNGALLGAIAERLTPATAWVLHRGVGYRRQVLRANLLHTPVWRGHRLDMEASVYRNLAAVGLETLAGLGMGLDAIRSRIQVVDVDLVRRSGPVLLVLGHVGNWEWLLQAAPALLGRPVQAVVRPQSVAFVDRPLARVRSRFGAGLCPEAELPARLRQLAQDEQPVVLAILADQWPTGAYVEHCLLGRRCRWSTAFATLARRYEVPVVYSDVRRIAPGRYSVRFERLSDPPHPSTSALVAAYVTCLERTIEHDPPAWLWTHRRWKA